MLLVDSWCLNRQSTDDAEDIVLAHDQVSIAVDLDFSAAVFRNQHLVAGFNGEIDFLAVVVNFTGAKSDDFATTLPSCGFSFAVSGIMMPPFFTSVSSIGCTSTRSPSGLTLTDAIISFSTPLFT